jgi:tetratricopeptide (TPR) repeat protein
MLAAVLGAGIRRLVTSGPGVRTTIAAAIASCVAFTAAAAIDWVWELPVLPVAFLLVAAAILGQVPVTRGEVTAVGQDPPRQARLRERVGVVALAILALIAIAVPFVSTRLVQESQSQLRSGEPDSALRSAEAAETVNPFATTANRQQALALERSGELARAVDAGRDATRDEPTNWRSWLLLSHLEAKRGRAEEAADAYNRAFALNPSSSVFTFEDFVTTLNVHTDASVGRGSDFRGIQVGIQGKRLGPNDRLLATAEPGGVGLRLYKVVNGVYTQLGSNGTFTLLANTDYWLQFQIEGNALEARLYASDPDFGNPSSVASTSHTLTGRDASTFGKGVMGKLGIETSPTGTDWSYDDWRVNTRDGSALRDEPAGFASSLAG